MLLSPDAGGRTTAGGLAPWPADPPKPSGPLVEGGGAVRDARTDIDQGIAPLVPEHGPAQTATDTHPARPSPRATALDVRTALIRAGGFSRHAGLAADTSRRAIDAAVEAGLVVRTAYGVYALPTAGDAPTMLSFEADAAARAAARAERVGVHRRWAGSRRLVLSHRSAAEYHGFELLRDPPRPEAIIKRGTRLDPTLRRTGEVRQRRLAPDDHRDGVTTAVRTVLDCAADLPFAQALAIADSAIRPQGEAPPLVGVTELLGAAHRAPKRTRAKVRRVAECADPGAANAFESALRAIALEVPGLCVETQVVLTDTGQEWFGDLAAVEADACLYRVDLADRRLRIVLEADSYTWHGTYGGFAKDCWRYSCLVAGGWLVLRLTWDAVMNRPDEVRALLERLVDLRIDEVTCRACGFRAGDRR